MSFCNLNLIQSLAHDQHYCPGSNFGCFGFYPFIYYYLIIKLEIESRFLSYRNESIT